jgi:MOSC domain-containing protein YiiM
VVGDRQADRRDHGRPFQALCLWSTEVTDELRADGHPIAPGLAGENVSLTGLPWPRVRPGARLRLGDVLAEVSSYAVPCSKNARWFTGGRFDVIHHDKGPYSRVYATVLEPGRITEGDPVLLEPGS